MQRYIFLMLTLVLCPSLALARTWTNREGKEIIADFVDATEEKVTLKKSDGKVVTFKLELLSEDDQQFIRGVLARRVGKKPARSSEEPGSPFESVPSATKPAPNLKEAVASKGSDEKVEGLGTMRDVNEAKKKMKIENREWSDVFGNKSAGKFIRFQGNNVLVLRSGRQVTLDYWQLSDTDKEYLKELCEAYGQSHLIPKFNPAEQRNNGPGANVAGNLGGSGPAPGISNTPSSPPPGAFAGGAPGLSSSPPSSFPSSPRIGDPEELARRLRELEEKAKSATTYSPPPLSPTAGSSAYPPPGGTSYSPSPSASASYAPPPGASASPPAGASYSPPPGAFSSPSMGSSAMPSSTMPGSSMSGPSMPSIPNPTFNVPGMGVGEKQCGSCGKVLPASFTAGDRCPGCGVYFSHDDTNGKTANPGFFGGGGGAGGGAGPSRGVIRGIIVLVVLGIKAMAYMAWRSQQS